MVSIMYKETTVIEFARFIAPRVGDHPEQIKAKNAFVRALKRAKPHEKIIVMVGVALLGNDIDENCGIYNLIKCLSGRIVSKRACDAIALLPGWSYKIVSRRQPYKYSILKDGKDILALHEGQKIARADAIEIAAEHFCVGWETARNKFYQYQRQVRAN
jgi:hypothetical protein